MSPLVRRPRRRAAGASRRLPRGVLAALLVLLAAAPGPARPGQPPARGEGHPDFPGDPRHLSGFGPGQPPARRGGRPDGSSRTPAVPPGALRVVNWDWRAGRSAVCAEQPGAAADPAGRPIRRTRVWVRDGTATRQVALGPGACDPAWSPDGDRLAVVTPDGLWVLSADLRRTTQLVDVRAADGPRTGVEHRGLRGPQWSPDASALAFVVSNGRTTWVEAVDARTGARRYASDLETYEFAWEADSRSLRFGSRIVRIPAPAPVATAAEEHRGHSP